MTNTNLKTETPYGYISANALDPEVVERLLNGSQARDLSYESYLDELREEVQIAASERGLDPEDPDYETWCEDEVDERLLSDDYCCDEPEIEGIYEGVHYRTSWLGGALNFWIFESPFTTDKARRASPCVPGAAILDTLDGDEYGYDVPPEWRAEA